MKAWTRWQDWVTLGAGVVAAFAAFSSMSSVAGASALMVLGAAMVIAALISLAMPDLVVMEYVKVALGLLMIVSPWMFGFAAVSGTATTAWTLGLISLAASLWAAPLSVEARQHTHHHTPTGA
ncbi:MULTISPECIES: SPW repeat protein [unclassified Arthrobacter]|uniref:SPW repeat domain-containing protein n=1 Tax=unclassified Arthrobacter TaxID=235627 RepID=UPI00159E9135|nr:MULTISPECIES: SPW repeat protein [unclassified Arthrobacter]MCQ9163208.1 SPW repeat protein [Arthrobacter sp. STN4]NVM98570.1 hypothetical protein [Arthrobacter sp. SDTb3-6]